MDQVVAGLVLGVALMLLVLIIEILNKHHERKMKKIEHKQNLDSQMIEQADSDSE